MGFFKSTKGSIISDYFKLLDDVGSLPKNNMTDVALYADHLALKQTLVKQIVTLDYSQITDVFYGFSDTIELKNKSVVGRAVVGGILFGEAGAIVGGMTGNGQKEKKVTKKLLIISYLSSTGEDSFLQFEDSRHCRGDKVVQKLKELCGITDQEDAETRQSNLAL